MKFLIFVFVAYITDICANKEKFTLEEKKRSDKQVEACAAEYGIDLKELETLLKSGIHKGTKKLDCFSMCILQKSRVMNSEGKFDFSDPNESQQAKNCKQLKGKDNCQTGGKVLDCLLKHHIVPLG